MQLGFVIDHSRCIGCHACTVACKAENDVPVGSFRTWVKYTERGSFPEVRRSFAVLRCNQCTDAPCVTICPVHALEKRPDGIVDVDPERCIGCKSCMQGCPYDALYLNEASGTAEKCHFCAHRTEVGLAPACAVVCPTEAIIPGDFDDPADRVAQMRKGNGLRARKTEAGTGPNVVYNEAASEGLNPLETQAGEGFLWANQIPGLQLDAHTFAAAEKQARARTVYDVEHPPLWGRMVSAYLWTKSVSAGLFLAGLWFLPTIGSGGEPGLWRLGLILALAFLALTTALLVGDLKRPERFLFILRHANWSSWLTRGSIVLMAYAALLSAWLVVDLIGRRPGGWLSALLAATTAVAALATAVYTAWLFGQAKGRVLWMRRGLALELAVHAALAGSASWTLLVLAGGSAAQERLGVLRAVAVAFCAAQLVLQWSAPRMSPAKREEEYRRVYRLVSAGPFATRHRLTMIGSALAIPLFAVPGQPLAWAAAALVVLVTLALEQDTLVRAGQAFSIS
ncbi:MAG: ferredoxin [Acidobacteria bacterium]|nr:ferredoxin [Acidobacteriota bacterium]NIM62042.1 ferredoxin [Acidobacteriota bacterium]NIQ85846.1 ferredoxin [Acidobacteriota bacterium]NIT11397.1 ferredoxin [Acidobacteriota bacterium]